MINWRSMSREYDGDPNQPRSQYDYFIKFWAGRFYNSERVPEDMTIGEYVAQRKREVKGFVLQGIATEWKGLSEALQTALSGRTRRRKEIEDGGTEYDIIMGTRRFA